MAPLSDGQVVEQILAEYAAIPYAHGQFTTIPIFDHENQRYALMVVGWDGPKRVHYCLVHVEVHDGKIWVERDNTEEGIATDLMRAGIPKERIVLAFHRPEVRMHSGFAVA